MTVIGVVCAVEHDCEDCFNQKGLPRPPVPKNVHGTYICARPTPFALGDFTQNFQRRPMDIFISKNSA